MSNPFTELRQQQQEPSKNPFAMLRGEDTVTNPFAAIRARQVRQLTTEEAAASAAAFARASMPFEERHPLLNALLVQPFKDAADALVVSFTPQDQLDALAQEDPEGTIHLVNNAQRGLAFLASLPVGATFTKIPGITGAIAEGAVGAGATVAASRVIGSAGAFLTGEFLSGSVYGAIEPISPEQSRVGTILTEGAIFAALGGTVAGGANLAGRGFKRYILALPRAKRIAAIRLANEQLASLDAALKAEGGSINALPPEAKASLVTQTYRNVLAEIEPTADLDLDRVIREQAELDATVEQRAAEPHPRLGPEGRPQLELGSGSRELELPDPLGDIELAAEFKKPARVEPAVKPKGFIEGAGQPERGIELEVYRGVNTGRDPLEPGVAGAIFTSPDRDLAAAYGIGLTDAVEADLHKMRIRLRNPLIVETTADLYERAFGKKSAHFAEEAEIQEKAIPKLKAMGYDGAVVRNAMSLGMWAPTKTEVIVFDKSAITASEQVRGVQEYVVAPVVRGAGGKTYPGMTHPDAIADAIESGVKASEFESLAPAQLSANMGFSTNLRPFVSREEASIIADRYAGMAPRAPYKLDAYDVAAAEGKPGLLPIDAPPGAWNASNRRIEAGIAGGELERTANDVLDAFEPRELTPGQPPPKGFEPTAVGAEAEGAPTTIEQLAMANAAVKDAVARIDPVRVADIDVRAERVILEDALADPAVPAFRPAGERLAAALDKALGDPGSASAEGILLEITEPSPGEIVLGQKVPPKLAKQMSRQLGESLRAPAELVEISPMELVHAQWSYGPGKVSTPQLDVLQTVVRMSDEHLELVAARMQKLAMGELAEPVLRPGEAARPIPGTKGIEITGTRATPPVPTQPTILEMQLGRIRKQAAVPVNPATLTDDQVLFAVHGNDFVPSAETAVALRVGGKVFKGKNWEEAATQAVRKTRPFPLQDWEYDAIQDGRYPVRRKGDPSWTAEIERGYETVHGDFVSNTERETVTREARAKLESKYGERKPLGTAGFITGRALALLLGSGAEIASLDDDLPPGPANVLRAVGGLLLAASLHGTVKQWMQKSGFMRERLLDLNPTFLFKNAGAREAARKLVERSTWARELRYNQEKMIEAIFGEHKVGTTTHRNAILAIEESDFAQGIFPAEYHMLTANQQKAVESLNLFNLALGQLLHSEGILKAYRRNYVSHMLPPETFQRWTTHGFRVLPTAGGFTKQRVFTFRELEAWAAQQGLPGPVTDLAQLQGKHISQAWKSISNVRLINDLTGLGLIKDAAGSALTPPPAGWRQIRIAGYGTKEAPDEIAHALENLAAPTQSGSEVMNSLDTVKSYWMRSIMFWFWEHGINTLRAATLSSLNPVRYAQAWDAIANMDHGVMEAAKHGLNLRQRTDYAELARSVERVIQKTGNIPVLNQLVKLGGGLMKFNERVLWEKLVPTMQYMVYSKEMLGWSERTGGKLLPGSPEYITAARKAADVANTVMGRLPTDLANPRLLQWMRLIFFSPQWTTTRIAMTSHAAGELGEILEGKMNPLQASYLPMKLRQVAYMAALTWVGSKLLSGDEPEFNPHTNKFYMKTGLKNANGREVGIDIVGFWQDDLKLFNAPFDFIAGRLNPTLRVAGETITGRDYLGRPMTGVQKLENIVRSAGVPVEALELGVRTGQTLLPGGVPGMTGGEVLNRVSGSLATFNVASLPRPIDATIGKMATRLLRLQGLPTDEATVFELSRLLRGNLMAGHPLIDKRVMTYLAYRRRIHSINSPLGAPVEHLWQSGRRVLADF